MADGSRTIQASRLNDDGVSASCAGVVNHSSEGGNIQFRTDYGTLRLQLWRRNIVRVQFHPNGRFTDGESLSVVGMPDALEGAVTEISGAFVVETDALKVCVDRKTSAVTFADKNGCLLAQEKAGARAMTSIELPFYEDLDVYASKTAFVLEADEAIFGLGQHQNGLLDYRGETIDLVQMNGQIAVPFAVSSKGYGILWDNPAISRVSVAVPGDDADALVWDSSAAKEIDYYFVYGPKIDDVISGYRDLTGQAPMPGKWALGLWQCKERYQTQDEIVDIAQTYRDKKLPLDGIIQDWQYWPADRWGSHDFDVDRYSDPQGMVNAIHDKHLHMLISVWPKFDIGTDNSNELIAAGAMFPTVTRYVYPPGSGQWYDPFGKAGRVTYWRQIWSKLGVLGIDGWWLDASEVELSGNWGELSKYRTATGPGALVHNAYPLQHARGVYEGQRAKSDERVLILSRSSYAGAQRNAVTAWSGDIQGTWETLAKQIPAALNYTLAGAPYWNSDIGGFFVSQDVFPQGADDPGYRELFVRWFQFGVFCPMFRVHGCGLSKELWRFGPACEAVLKKFDELRYRLMPYIYATAAKTTFHGGSFMRALVFDFADDPNAVRVRDQFMFGSDILVSPVVEAGAANRTVYLPAGTDWFDFWTGERYHGGRCVDFEAPLDIAPMAIKAGAILPLSPVMQYADEVADAPIELRIYPGADGESMIYEDDGHTYNYEKGEFATTLVTWNDAARTLTIGAREGDFPELVKSRTYRIVVVGEGFGTGIEEATTNVVTVEYRGQSFTVHQ